MIAVRLRYVPPDDTQVQRGIEYKFDVENIPETPECDPGEARRHSLAVSAVSCLKYSASNPLPCGRCMKRASYNALGRAGRGVESTPLRTVHETGASKDFIRASFDGTLVVAK